MVSQMALLGMFMLDANMSAVDHETNRQQAGELRKSFERTGLDPIAFTRRLMEFINQGNDTIAKMTGVPPIEEHFVIQGKVK